MDINALKPEKGTLGCHLWENKHIRLPLSLFYAIEIPLSPFDSGHDYVPQPTETAILMDWLKLTHGAKGTNEKNWKHLAGKEFFIADAKDTGSGSIYLGSEHCPFDANLKFLSLEHTTFDIELTLAVDFNIETINLDPNGKFTIRTKVDFEGFMLWDNESLPTVAKVQDPMKLLPEFIDLAAYHNKLDGHKQRKNWRQLTPVF
ncbi:hypothetical protein [Paraflavitalea sp. CAU 1676]|uniref:hypothetical protein n=1 Tax=Paraflavitalea sp. CAU 1676 TaxID=3032598 RepID=UPI0023DA721F|nr:hypothetical protein [Paraflavitalea sp. CAU 1676]MDF2192758.1 hypothetical protein [Paraflavitalea sp. CAU 1676]